MADADAGAGAAVAGQEKCSWLLGAGRARIGCVGGIGRRKQLGGEGEGGGGHWPGGRTNCSSDAESKGAQLISRLSTLWGKFVPLPVRRAMLHYEFTRCLSVFSCQPITCRSSSDGDGNGDGDLAPKMLVHDTKPAKLKTKSGRLVLSLRTKMPPRRILEPSRAAAPPPPKHGVHQLLRPWLPNFDLQT